MANIWSEEELLAAMYLYTLLPFGRLHKGTREIVILAERLERTPSSVAMKLGNFASLDPAHQARGVKGLSGASRADRAVWSMFAASWAESVERAADAYDKIIGASAETPEVEATLPGLSPLIPPSGPTEVTRAVRGRRGQDWFRKALDVAYEQRCAVSGCALPELLVASHIVRWADDEVNRLNPHNGLLLSTIHDRAFETGHLAFTDDHRVLISKKVLQAPEPFLRQALGSYDGAPMRLPNRFIPDTKFLRQHRESRFLG
ncbi:HNH endonuclease [Myxococcota bacterium]|nr:HNH endonuclease [Myxococcota bacterium]